ncbi:MAG: 30S ribosomal protein S16 [Chloroflexi bacterium]|nr:30S ribosomal protein S16 [Chloroflexota bacterium]
MSVKIRLARYGAKKQPTYRVVIAEERTKRDGRIVENVGHYDPRTEPPTVVLNEERTRYWLGVGARPSDAVGVLLRKANISDQYIKVHAARKSRAAVKAEAKPA